MRYRWLLFDADGTLFDYDNAERLALEATLARLDYTMARETHALYREFNSALWRQLEAGTVTPETLRWKRFESLFDALDLPLSQARDAGEHYLVELANHGTLFPGADEIVRACAERARLAIITNGLADVQRKRLGDSPIAGLFDALTISGELGIAKPDRRIIDHTLAVWNDPPRDEVLIIGDSLSSDIQGGINAGIATCWLSPDGAAAPEDGPQPKHTISRLSEVLNLLA